jgi:hypothetical protein
MKENHRQMLEQYISQKASQIMFEEKHVMFEEKKSQYEIDLSGIDLNGTKDGDHIEIIDTRGNCLGDAFFTPDENNGNKMTCYFSPREYQSLKNHIKNGQNYSDTIPKEIIKPKGYIGKSNSSVKIYKVSPTLKKIE